jgi:cyclase
VRAILLGLAALVALVPHAAGAVTGDTAELRKVADDVYAFVGKRNDANALVIVTRQGVALVDTGNNPPETRALRDFVRSLTERPVRWVIVTQNHGDHIGGAPLFAPPAKVIVHERVAKDWAAWKPYQVKSWRKRFRERAAELRDVDPVGTTQPIRSSTTLLLGGTTIELIYVDDPYNPGDLAVWLPQSGVLHAGFAGYIGRHPDIRPDYSHGTTAGLLRQLEVLSALNPRVLVPAHGPLGDAGDLRVLRDYLLLAREKVRMMMLNGASLNEITKTFAMSEYKGWDRENHFEWLAETVYRELKGEGPQQVRIVDRETSGTIVRAEDEGRRLVVRPGLGPELRLRITADSDIDGAATDRSQLRAGMKVKASYQVPEGFNPALGYDVMEMSVSP